MTREEVFKLIQELNDKQSETISIEAKTAYQGKPEKYYDTISSFANTIGACAQGLRGGEWLTF